MKKFLICAFQLSLVLLLVGVNPLEIKAQRQMRTINESWKFLKGENLHASDSLFNDNEWTDINLPHTWNTDERIFTLQIVCLMIMNGRT